MIKPSSLLLIHSPVVGPSTWQPIAARARDQGAAVAIPDLTSVLDGGPGPLWSRFVDTAITSAVELHAPIVVCGHSAAGALLPRVGDALGSRLGHMVFVDAVVPPVQGSHVTPARLKELLDQHTNAGVLGPWLDWWDDEVLEALLPDLSQRTILRADLPELPRSYYDEEIPVAEGWSTWGCRYLRLSPAYDAELERARGLRWPTASIDGTHLSIFTHPGLVLENIRSLVTDQLPG